MTAAETTGYRLDYDAKWFLPVPTAFPDGPDSGAEAWVDRVLAERSIMEPWRDQARRPVLRDLLLAQQREASGHGGAVLWYCPFGLPASGIVELAIEDREGRPGDARAELEGLRGELPIRPVEVRAAGLGPGVGYTRVIRAGGESGSGAQVAEMGYVFTPGGYAVAIRARSADPAVVGLLAEELWRLVDSVVLS